MSKESEQSEQVLARLAGRRPTDYARIRKRAWYVRWKTFADFLDTNPSKKAILREFDKLMDRTHGYRYAHIAGASFEALELVIKDRNW